MASEQLEIDWWPVDRPVPYVNNPRKRSASAIDKVAASIQEFGWKQPIVVDAEGVVIVGHTRLLAAQRLGLEHVPVHIARDLTPAQVKAYRLADNRVADETAWDEELLEVELEGLLALDVDLAMSGFDVSELKGIGMKDDAGLDPEPPLPEPPDDPIAQPGDVWTLGGHRIMCGDSTDAGAVAILMDGQRATLMATDPPYLVDYDGTNHLNADGGKVTAAAPPGTGWDAYGGKDAGVAFYVAFLRAALAAALAEHTPIYQWFAMMRCDVVYEAWAQAGLLLHQVLIWKKGHGILGHTHFMWDYEPFAYGWKQGSDPAARPPAAERTCWEVGWREGNEKDAGHDHPTMKPVELIRRCIGFHTAPGAVIYEPFSGSGTAIVAAEQTQRRCFAMELSPAFVDVAVQRWENLTGQKATCDTSGRVT